MEERNILVAIRKRPLGRKELSRGDSDIVEKVSDEDMVVSETRCKVDLTKYVERHTFTFDAVFDERTDNEAMYTALVKPLVSCAFNRGKVNCFAYGQTGSGKTYTMMGDPQNDVPGLYLLAAQDIFAKLVEEGLADLSVGISFYEIYCGKAYDLLNGREPCFIRVDAKENVNIVNLTEKPINSTQSLMALIYFGLSVRITGQTGANDESSRSHAILQINLRTSQARLFGRMSFIDLAGSERGADVTDTNKQTRLDGAEINKSLLALKECIRALDQNKNYLPFRGSKLTMVLKDSFVGNCRTVMIGNVSPSANSSEHTLNTLRYADRVKELKRGRERAVERDHRDELAQQLMLPRLNKNSCKVEQNERNDSEPPAKPQPRSSAFGQSVDRRSEGLPRAKAESKDKIVVSEGFRLSGVHQDRNTLFGRVSDSKVATAPASTRSLAIDVHHNHVDALVALIRKDLEMINAAKKAATDTFEYVERAQWLIEEKQKTLEEFKRALRRLTCGTRLSQPPPLSSPEDDLLNLTEQEEELI